MSQDDILGEIRRIRDEHARECDYDVHVMFEQMRAETEKLKAEGWKVVSIPARPMLSTTLAGDPSEPNHS